MIIVRTPLRVSFFGGGTDHPSWFNHYGPGAVLSTTIDKYVYISLRYLPPVFDFKYRLSWRIVEQKNTLDEIEHPVIREVLRHYAPNPDVGFEMAYNADLPAQSGLGSSSAFSVAALHALSAHEGLAYSKLSLAKDAIRVEQNLLSEPVGSQDQTAVAFGGLNRIDFRKDQELSVAPIEISAYRRSQLESHLMMFFTGFTREASKVESSKIASFATRTKEMERLYEHVSLGEAILRDEGKSIHEFGELLHDAWVQKRALSNSVSNTSIDEIYQAAQEAGALGGKLLGAGGGGFVLLFVPPEAQPRVYHKLVSLKLANDLSPVHVPFKFENKGSEIVMHQPELTSNYSGYGTRLDGFDPQSN
jgi:D-glycero-alpha-D-manno-heptose-7-phosphate kinase